MAAAGLVHVPRDRVVRALRTVRVKATLMIVALFVLQVPATYWSVSLLRQSHAAVQRAQEARGVVSEVEVMLVAMAGERDGLFAYLLTADSSRISVYEQAYAESETFWLRLVASSRGTDLAPSIRPVQDSMDAWDAWAARGADLVSRAHSPIADQAVSDEGSRLYTEFRAAVTELDRLAMAQATRFEAVAARTGEEVYAAVSWLPLAGGAVLVVAASVLFVVALRPVARLAEVARGLAAGQELAVPYVARRDEIGQLAGALVRWQETEVSRQAVVRERLAQAAGVQRELLPDTVPRLDDYDLAGTCMLAEEVGGDFFDWSTDVPGTLTLSLGDVMGKGLSAAILMAAVGSALRAGSRLPTVQAAVESLADSIARNIEKMGMFVTLFHGRLDVATGTVTYVDAGHGLALVIRAGGEVLHPGPTSLPLGTLANQTYRSASLLLEPGDALIVFSDGVLDAHPDLVHPQQVGGLLVGAETASEMASRLIGAASTGSLVDDITVVAIRRDAAPALAGQPLEARDARPA